MSSVNTPITSLGFSARIVLGRLREFDDHVSPPLAFEYGKDPTGPDISVDVELFLSSSTLEDPQ